MFIRMELQPTMTMWPSPSRLHGLYLQMLSRVKRHMGVGRQRNNLRPWIVQQLRATHQIRAKLVRRPLLVIPVTLNLR